MENRFGVKDFFLFMLLIGLIGVVFLAMQQFDRQWKEVQAIKEDLSNQTRELSQLRRTIERGVRVSGVQGGNPSASSPGADKFGDPFVYVNQAKQKPDYALGDWVVEYFPVRLARLTPLGLSGDLYSRVVQNRIQESLAYTDPYTLDDRPLLAESWQISEDGLTITFHLRTGVTFSDGQPFTADDVVFTYEWIMNPAVAAPRERAYYSKIKSVEKKGDYEVVFQFKEPYYESFSLAAGLQIMPKHFYEKFAPEQFNSLPGLMMGTGPYQLQSPDAWKPGQLIELVRNERYWGEPGPYDKIVYHEVEQDSAALTMFKNGEIDVFAATPEQYEELLKDEAIRKRATNYEYQAPQGGYSYIGWNQQKKGKATPFADKRVRQAMTMLTDRERIIKEIWLGHGKVASGPFSPLLEQSDPNIKPWPYDPQKARQLLKEAGYEDRNGDGIIEGPNGQPFRFALTYGSKSPMIERMALFLKDSYAKAGIGMDLDPSDWPIMLKKIDGRDFDAITLAWGGSIEGDAYQIFHSSQMGDNGDNYVSYANPELDKVIEQARSTVEKQKRMPLWQQVHRILHEDQPYTFMVSRVSLSFVDKRIQNIEPSKLGLNYSQLFVMPIPWYIPKDKQKWSR